MKTARKGENDKFSDMTLKPISGKKCHGNRPRTPKLWATSHQNDSKT